MPSMKTLRNLSSMEEGFASALKVLTEVSEKVINIIKEYEAETPESVLDRAHRIGPVYTDNDTGKKDAKHNCQICNI